ncbi:hypothetical protein O1L60_30285 [Streptomyces diastatochromogenes]|nr:hypothetical protein [Streptomyces diastatochromogenes]
MSHAVRAPSPAWDGTEAEASELLGWLTDPEAPRLCLVTGAPGSGKTALLGWLAAYGPRSGRSRRRAHRMLVPLAGQSALGVAWTIADRLGVVARSPGDLVHALATTEARPAAGPSSCSPICTPPPNPPRSPGSSPSSPGSGGSASSSRPGAAPGPRRPARRAPGHRRRPRRRARDPGGPVAEPAPALPDLSDPAAVCTADPLLVTTAYVTGAALAGVPGTLDGPEPSARPGEGTADEHGGLRTAWMRAGQSLCREQDPTERALVLLAALGDGADPGCAPRSPSSRRARPGGCGGPGTAAT